MHARMVDGWKGERGSTPWATHRCRTYKRHTRKDWPTGGKRTLLNRKGPVSSVAVQGQIALSRLPPLRGPQRWRDTRTRGIAKYGRDQDGGRYSSFRCSPQDGDGASYRTHYPDTGEEYHSIP